MLRAMPALHLPRFDHGLTRDTVLLTAAGLVLGLLGPFGSYLNGSPIVVAAYWMACLWGAAGLLIGVGTMMRPWTGRWAERRGAVSASLILAVLLASVPAALLSRLIAAGLWPGPIARVPPWEWYGQTLLVLVGLAAGRAILAGLDRTAAPPPPPPVSPPTASGLLDRLPPQLGRDVVALQMEDHYVRVHTRAGSALVLMPLRQAVRALEPLPGLIVHRSWWVAREAVTGCRRDGRNLRLVLANGLVVPVARARLAAAREARLVGDEACSHATPPASA
ncbi:MULTISPECIES: LytTR family DNA-binding domain-containing protein [Methylobacterium]|uniref:LytTR family DNA-binding domain-containing protein n=1 Tax=Methylobacterium TaxID=407 RepID=UPI0013E9F4CB|nr:LytTR family DNA-binding domain-containing protein [Methylobacterium sp. DB0501]NGM32628.1 LytTR family transcriptional regulator [Methylobacterium sp. DB0501]